MLKKLIAIVLVGFSGNVLAYVNCSNVTVSAVESSIMPTFHKFNENGMSGKILFVKIDKNSCTNSTGEPLADYLYVVIDQFENADEQKQLWASMLLSAATSGKKIQFHANDNGVNSTGKQVLQPYYLAIRN